MKTFKEDNEIVQQGFEAPRMANPKDNQILMKESKLYNLKMAPKFII